MRTTIELKPEHRARLLELAARRGEKGFSSVIAEAVDAYLATTPEGDRVRKGQDVLELETEKAVAAVPSTTDGVITKILVQEGQQVAIGQPLLQVKDEAGSSSAPSAPKPSADPAVRSAAAPIRAPSPTSTTASAGPSCTPGN